MKQFAGIPEGDGDHDLAEPRGRGRGRPKAKAKAKARAKAGAKARAKAKAKAAKGKQEKPKAKAKAKAAAGKAKAKATRVRTVGDQSDVELATPKRKAPKGDVEEGSRSKKRQPKAAKNQKDKDSEPRKRASKGEAVSFARRNPPGNPRGKAEWDAIKSVFGERLSHLHPRSKHEDISCQTWFQPSLV